MEAESIRIDIIRPALKLTGTWSTSAEFLILYTGAAETGYRVLRQINGPGLGPFSMEPSTFSATASYLNRRQPEKRDEILKACGLKSFPEASALMWNLRLAVLMARMRYWWHPEVLPEHDDIIGLAHYWKTYYNTVMGKGTIKHFVQAVKDLK